MIDMGQPDDEEILTWYDDERLEWLDRYQVKFEREYLDG